MAEIREPGVLERLADNLALLTGAVATLTAAISGAQSQDSPSPKATWQRKSSAGGSTLAAESTSPAPVTAASQVQPDQAASGAGITVSQIGSQATTQPTESDDLFGDDKAEAPKKEAKVKPATQDDVRAALVAVQTALKSKDAAIAILTKHTTGNVGVLSKLPEGAYAALIAECKQAVAKAPK